MNKLGLILVAMFATYLTACGGPGTGTLGGMINYISSYSETQPNNLRISLTDAPSRELKNVFVNVDHAELFIKKGSTEKRVLVAQGLGMVDLLTLRNGVLLPMHDLTIPEGVEITGIRLVLAAENNHSIKMDGSRCEMQTPSGQQSGIKIHLSQPFTIGAGYTYSMVMDFDAAKSVVIKGNGDCLLKPVLKMLTVTRHADVPVDDVTTLPFEEPVTDGTDTNTGGTTDSTTEEPTGFENPDTTIPYDPDLIAPEDIPYLD